MSKEHLKQLEAESIYIMREVAAQFERPALLFSGGKDSITLVHLAMKAFAPMKIPFPLVHIDTGHNFPEALAYRDALAKRLGAELIVRQVEDTIKAKGLTEPKGKFASRNWLQTHTLLDTIEEFHFDACIGGARRDEEKARAKEETSSVSGIPSYNVLNCGTSITAGYKKAKMCAYSPFQTGQNSMCGAISNKKKLNSLLSISLTTAR